MPRHKKGKRFDKKAGVEFRLMYRDHRDPLYYDPGASGRILVPTADKEALPLEKQAIIESVPAEDRGEILDEAEYAKRGYGKAAAGGADLKQNLASLIESDQVLAAAKRRDIKLQHAIDKRIAVKKAQASGKGVLFKEDLENEDDDEDYDSEEEESGTDSGMDSEEREWDRAAREEIRRRRELAEADEEKENEEEIARIEALEVANASLTTKGVQVYRLKDLKEPLEDVNKVLREARSLYKAADGVTFAQYDGFGYKLGEGGEAGGAKAEKETKPSADGKEDWRQYLAKEGDDAGFEFIAAPEASLKVAQEIMAKQQFKGGRKDVDIKEEDMNEEEQAVFKVLDGSDVGAEDEIDDDFLAMLNDGMPALLAKDDAKEMNEASAAAEDKGVIRLEDEPDKAGLTSHPMMLDSYKERMAGVLEMLEKQEEFKKEAAQAGKRQDVIDVQARKLVNQKQYDDVFAAYLEKEYNDDQIGDLEGDPGVDPLAFIEEEEERAEDLAKAPTLPGNAGATKEEEDDDEYIDYGELTDGDEMDVVEAKQMQDAQIINEAVDEFIQDKRLWFRDLHKEHDAEIQKKAKEKGESFLPGTVLFVGDPGMVPVVGQPGEEEERRILKERTLEAREEPSESDEEDTPSEDSEEKWDAETILTTYTNTDNHPNIIKYVPKVKPSQRMKIELHKQFKVPIDGLDGLIPVAEVIIKEKKTKKANKSSAFEEDTTAPPEQPTEATGEEEDDEEEEDEAASLNPRKQAKKEMKAERRERRKQKKELKVAFSQQKSKLVKQQTAPHAGAIRPGVSQRKIH